MIVNYIPSLRIKDYFTVSGEPCTENHLLYLTRQLNDFAGKLLPGSEIEVIKSSIPPGKTQFNVIVGMYNPPINYFTREELGVVSNDMVNVMNAYFYELVSGALKSDFKIK